MTRDYIHEAGAHRHMDRWLHANLRAIEAARAIGVDYRGEKEKMCIALIVLKVLDGQMLDTGFVWSVGADKWMPRTEYEQAHKVAKRLQGETI